ncbi:MAG: IS5 family transposase [Thermoguttaceae bacterium]
MVKPLIPDELWEKIKPLLPPHNPRLLGGRPPVDDRNALTGIVFVLKTGIPWEQLPQEMGCGSGMTCWRRLRDWQQAGVWETVKQLLLDQLREADKLDLSRVAVDSSLVRAFGGGAQTGPNPTDRRRPGSKHHTVTDANGVPLVTHLTAANRHDTTELIPLIDDIPPVAGKPGKPRKRPDDAYADRAYDSEPHRKELRKRGIKPHLARRNTPHGSGLGIFRWVAERGINWLHGFRRLRVRYDRRADIQAAFILIAECLICFRVLVS